MRNLILLATHTATLVIGFALGVYFLPIITAPPGPTAEQIAMASKGAILKGRFERNLKGSDTLHWGEGDVMVGRERIVHTGKLAPGPDYKVYLVRGFVDTKAGFLSVKDKAVRIGDVKTFDGFIATVPAGVDIGAYDTIVVWCEAFGQFITAAKYS